MKRKAKIACILICLVLVTTVLSTSGACSIMKNKKSNNLLIMEQKEYIKFILRGKIRDLQVNESGISFIPVRLVVTIIICIPDFRYIKTHIIKDTNERTSLPSDIMAEFNGFYTKKYILGYFIWDDFSTLEE